MGSYKISERKATTPIQNIYGLHEYLSAKQNSCANPENKDILVG